MPERAGHGSCVAQRSANERREGRTPSLSREQGMVGRGRPSLHTEMALWAKAEARDGHVQPPSPTRGSGTTRTDISSGRKDIDGGLHDN